MQLFLCCRNPEIGQHDRAHQLTHEGGERLGAVGHQPLVDDRQHSADDALRRQRRRLGNPRGALGASPVDHSYEELHDLRATLQRARPGGERLDDAQPG